MQKLIFGLAVFGFLSGCATVSPTLPNDRDEEIRSLNTDLATAREQVAALEQRADQLNAERQSALANLAQSEVRIAMLEQQIQEASSSVDSQPGHIAELQRQLQRSRNEAQTARSQSDHFQSRSNSLEDELNGAQGDLDRLYAQMASQPSLTFPGTEDPAIAARSAKGVEPESDSPIIKTVFYATNRVRLVRHFSDYLAPFIFPVLLLIGYVVLSKGAQRYIKAEYQRNARILIVVLTLVPLVVLTLMAIQDVVQFRQLDKTLFVQYGNELRKPAAGESAYERGSVDISIPPQRNLGEVNRPDLIKLEFVVDAASHFQLASVRPSSDEKFYEDIQASFDEHSSRQIFVFVHGFHNTFEDAAFRTAQIAHDMKFKGAPMFFSWPSQGAVLDYLTDAKNVETTVKHLREFLEELHAESGAERIHLIAHSMGSRALAQAVERLDESVGSSGIFGQLIFAAPDIAKDLLEQKITDLDKRVDRLTLYASRHDSALQLSRALQGQEEDYQRAGETWPTPMVAPPMQTIDVSYVTKGHSYISNSPAMIRDLRDLIENNRTLNEESGNYVPKGTDAGYWILQDQ